MILLGIADNHDSGAAVLVDGRIASAVNQERLDRVKNSGAFPWAAIDEAIRVAGIRERDVDRVVFGTAFTPSAALRALPRLHAGARDGGTFSPLLHGYLVYQSALRKLGLHALEIDASRALLARRLQARNLPTDELALLDHHTAHAEGAWRTWHRDPALVITLDAMGDGTTATVAVGRAGQLEERWRQSGLAGIGTFYGKVTEYLGFRPNRHEGKVTGLAAMAEPPPELVAHMGRRVRFVGPGFLRVSARRPDRRTDAFWSFLDRFSREEVAAAAQRVLEDAVTAFVQSWIDQTGIHHVAVAGGIFANVKLNAAIARLPAVRELWVMPHMGDGGLALGAALGAAGAVPTALPDAYLGPEYGESDLYKAMKRSGAAFRRYEEGGDVERVARLLAEGKVVARLAGRMEWGPRALGHRSVFARPHERAVHDRLNALLGRSEFMPFAPVVRAEDAPRWFEGLDAAPRAARFMTVAFPATEEFRRLAPAAVHVDGTARPQVLDRATDPALHDLLGRVGELTGAPVLINTSFNLHEEPIVCTPSDAVRAYEAAGLDALWMGAFVAEGPRRDEAGSG